MRFHEQLIITIVDKGLLALLLAIAGFWLNRYLDLFRSRQALENELRKVRDQKRLDLLQSQLSQFYWPVYLRLEMDNAVWERILDRKSKDSVEANLGATIESEFILPNHEKTSQLIESSIHLAAPDSKVLDASVKYLRHVAVYSALRASGNKDTDPLDVGEPWPEDVFPTIQAATKAKQNEFELLLKAHTQDL